MNVYLTYSAEMLYAHVQLMIGRDTTDMLFKVSLFVRP